MDKESKIIGKDPIKINIEEPLRIADVLKQYSSYVERKASKIWLTCMQAPTLSMLISDVNTYNKENANNPILRDDIVEVLKYEEGWLLLYYK